MSFTDWTQQNNPIILFFKNKIVVEHDFWFICPYLTVTKDIFKILLETHALIMISAIFYYSCLTLRNRKKNSHQRTKLICLGTILDSRWISSVNLWRQKMSSLSTPATTLPTLPTPPTPILHLTTTKGMTDTIDLTGLIGNNFPEQKK